MIKRHMDIYTDLSECPLFAHQVRIHKQWGLISLYICNVCSVKCFPDYFEKKSDKNASNKIRLSHVNVSMAEKNNDRLLNEKQLNVT